MEQISRDKAIYKMRELSAKKIPFSFSHQTFDFTKREGGKLVEVQNARLRKSLRVDTFTSVDGDELLPYTDLETNEAKQCYKALLVSFNNQEIIFV